MIIGFSFVVFAVGCSSPPEEFGTLAEEMERVERGLGIDCEGSRSPRVVKCDWGIWLRRGRDSGFVTDVEITEKTASIDRLVELARVYGFSKDQVERLMTTEVDLELAGDFRLSHRSNFQPADGGGRYYIEAEE